MSRSRKGAGRGGAAVAAGPGALALVAGALFALLGARDAGADPPGKQDDARAVAVPTPTWPAPSPASAPAGPRAARPAQGLPFDVHLGFELSGYHDTDHVDVVTPALLASLESPTGGWGVSGSMLVDVVSAASADILASASPRWTELRYVPSLAGHKKFGDTDVSLHGTVSDEPDYLATTAGALVSTNLVHKTVTPSLGYDFSHDISGRSGTPFSVFSHDITRHALDASVTLILDKATFFAPTFVAVIENGDTSKPYRYIPMFSPRIAPLIPAGLSIDEVNAVRLPARVLEQLPTSRQRWALSGLLAHRFKRSTLRVEERLYADDWGLKASTTDAQYFVDLTRDLRLWPQARLHAQSPASFWRVAYAAEASPRSGTLVVPALRTGDRELGPLYGVTLGAGARIGFGEKRAWGLNLLGDVIYTRFLDHLYTSDRVGFFGATTLEADFE